MRLTQTQQLPLIKFVYIFWQLLQVSLSTQFSIPMSYPSVSILKTSRLIQLVLFEILQFVCLALGKHKSLWIIKAFNGPEIHIIQKGILFSVVVTLASEYNNGLRIHCCTFLLKPVTHEQVFLDKFWLDKLYLLVCKEKLVKFFLDKCTCSKASMLAFEQVYLSRKNLAAHCRTCSSVWVDKENLSRKLSSAV